MSLDRGRSERGEKNARLFGAQELGGRPGKCREKYKATFKHHERVVACFTNESSRRELMDQASLIYRENKARQLKQRFLQKWKEFRVIFWLETICCTSTKRPSSISSSRVEVSLVYIHLSCHPFSYSYGALTPDSSSLSLISTLIFKTANEMNIKHSNRFNSSPVIMFGPPKIPACSHLRRLIYSSNFFTIAHDY